MLFEIGREFGILPTDRRIMEMPVSHVLWMYGHILKKDLEWKKFIREQVKTLSYIVNPSIAKRVFVEDDKSGDYVVNKNIIEDIKKIAKGKDISMISSIIEGMVQDAGK